MAVVHTQPDLAARNSLSQLVAISLTTSLSRLVVMLGLPTSTFGKHESICID